MYATYYGYQNLDNFLANNYGTGNNEKTVRSIMARQQLISRYLSDLYESYQYTDEEKDAYYTENADNYDKVNYLYVSITASADDAAGVTLEDAQAAAEETTAVIASEGTDEEAFRTAAKEAGYEVKENSYVISSFLSLYGDEVTKDGLAPGTVFSHTSGSTSYAIYVLGTEDCRYNTVSVRHILIKCEDADGDGEYSEAEKQAALDKIKEIEQEWLAGAADEDSFAELATLRSEDAGSTENGGLYENIYKGQMVEEFDAFCYADHQYGDTGIVYGESSSYAGYHLIYFVSADGELYSRVLANDALRSEAYNAKLEELAEPYSATRTFMWRYVNK